MTHRIEVKSNIHFGKSCVAGTGTPVQKVLELVREGISFKKIIRDNYPDLQIEDICACIQYAVAIMTIENIHIAAVAV